MYFDPQSNRIGDEKCDVTVARGAPPKRARGDGLVFVLVVVGMLGGGWFFIENGTVRAEPMKAPIHVEANSTRMPVTLAEPPQPDEPVVHDVPAEVEPVPVDDVVIEEALDRGRLLCGMGRYREAIPVLDEAVAMDPRAADVRYQLALAHLRTRNLDSARAQLVVLEDLDPSLANLLRNLIR